MPQLRAAALAFCLLPLAAAAGGAASAPRRNVILVVVDALRADHLGAYGYARDTSPNIDRLAKEGVLFRESVAPSDWTLPSVASIMTSLYPPAHGAERLPRGSGWPDALDQGKLVLGAGQRLGPRPPTLAGILTARGFSTAGVVAGSFVFSPFGIGRGFSEYRDDWDDLRSLDDRVIFPWLAKHRRRPFFLYVHPIDVHDPYGVLAGEGGSVPRKWGREYHGTVEGRPEILAKINDGALKPSAEDLEHLASRYDDGISFLDVQVGRLLDRLREEDLEDRTLVILTSDHGEAFLEHGLVWHGVSAYDELLRVPLIMRLPGGPRGVAIPEQVSSVDVMPTVLDWLGFPAPRQAQGRSLLPLLRGRPAAARTVFGEALVRLPGGSRALAQFARTSDWKLVRFPAGRSSLYHLSEDPGEKRDVSAARPEVVRRLSGELAAWDAENERLRPVDEGAAPAGLDPATRRKLEAAGYLR